MSNFEFDANDFVNKLTVTETKTLATAFEVVEDSLDDLDRIASNIAPIDDSLLRKSSKKTVGLDKKGIVGELSFNATERTGKKKFNYAYWTHEMDYELGEKSANAPGTDGYHVGNKYVERPLKGEAERWVREWAQKIRQGIDG